MYKNSKGLLIELIMVMIIQAFYLLCYTKISKTIQKSKYHQKMLIHRIYVFEIISAKYTEGRRYYQKIHSKLWKQFLKYSDEGNDADVDNEWTFVNFTLLMKMQKFGRITHQRADNTRWQWTYNAGINHGTDNDVTGVVYKRTELGTNGSEVRFQ